MRLLTRRWKKQKPKTRRRKQRGGAGGLAVHFHTTGVNATASVGTVAKDKVQEKPMVTWSKQTEPVTFICWDPDAPQPSKAEGYLHWFASNQTDTQPTNPQFDWTPPAPPHGFPHHYYFGIFKQTDGVQVRVPDGRTPFNIDEFVATNKLVLLEKVGFITETTSWLG